MDPNIIFEQFIAQLKIYEETLDGIKTLSEEFDDDTDNDVLKLDRIVALMIKRKIYEYEDNHEKELLVSRSETVSEESEKTKEHDKIKELTFEVTDMLIEKDGLANKIYSTMYIEETEDNFNVKSKVPGLINFINNRIEDNNSHVDKNQVELRSILINLCITFESFMSQLLKEYYLNDPQANLKNQKTITFEELLAIDDMDSAKIFLVDQQLDDLFRKNFRGWYKEVSKSFDISYKDEEIVDSISEMYERRNLFVHTNGKVNSQYIKNTSNSSYEEGQRIDIETSYLREKINDIEYLCWITFDSFLKKQYRGDSQAFHEINDLMLKHIERTCPAIPQIYKSFFERNNTDSEIKLVAKVNYFLYYKVNGELESYKEELEEFQTSHLDVEFKVAKAILVDDPKALDMTAKFINDLDESTFFATIDWPLFKFGEYKDEIIKLLNIRLEEIMEGDVNEIN